LGEELAPPSLAHALAAVEGLQAGRTDARETAPVKPVDDATVEATLPHLPDVVADMVRFQRLTGCRPGEVCTLRPCDLDRSGEVWQYRPGHHKTQHHGRERIVYVGPQAQDVLRPYLLRDGAACCFSPADSERQRHAEQRAARRTPVQPSQQNRRARHRRRAPRDRYDKNSYHRAIERACERAFGMPAELRNAPKGETPEQRSKRERRARQWRRQHAWHPNRLRHTAATKIRQRFGLEAAQVLLGHSKADITQLYAERNNALGLQVAKQIG
jgi:integrase